MPTLLEFWQEYVFAEPIPWSEGERQEAEARVLARLQRHEEPLILEGMAMGTTHAVEVRFSDDGRVLRIRYDTGDVAFPV